MTITETSEPTTYRTEIYTNGSKDEGKCGAIVAIYWNKQLVTQCKYKLQNCCSNNQEEQIAILKTVEQLTKLDDPTGRIVAIFTESKVTIMSLKNHPMLSFLIEEIRNNVRHLSTVNWTIHFRWVKAHIGIEGNEVTDKLAKEAADELAKEPADKLAKEAADKLAKEAEDKLAKEAADKLVKEAADKLVKEAADKLAKESADKLAI